MVNYLTVLMFSTSFVDEDTISTEKLCITSVLMRKIFHKLNISSHFASSLRRFQSPGRNLYTEGEDSIKRYGERNLVANSDV